MIMGVDFDGTIVDHAYPEIGKPAPEAIKWLLEWKHAGAKLILWTMRSGLELAEAVRYLDGEGIELYGINGNPDQHAWTKSPKAYCQLYVDDAAYGCPLIQLPKFNRLCVDWSLVGPDVLARINKT